MLETYPWHKESWLRLSAIEKQKSLPHSLLLVGNEGIGLREFAHDFSMRLLCLINNDIETKACGNCKSCKLYLTNNHPDFSFVEPEKKGNQIKISKILELIKYVSLKSFSNKRKIVLIDPADSMNRSASNALLKTLEEPPKQSMIILLSFEPELIPITIRSRCQKLFFQPAYNSETIKWLDKRVNTELSIDLLLRIGRGGPLKVIDLVNDEKIKHRRTILMDLKSISDNKVDPIVIAKKWNILGIKGVIVWLLSLLQDLIRLRLLADKAELTNFDLKELLYETLGKLSLDQLIKNYDFLTLKYKEAIGTINYNPICVLEEIVLSWINK